MRRVAAALALVVAGTCFGSVALGRPIAAKVHVHLKVPKACTVHTPARVSVGPTGVVILSANAILSECTDDESSAVALSVYADPADKGSDVATINF